MPAIAGVSGIMNPVVEPISPTVTYKTISSSGTLQTYVGYTVSITNTGTNTANSVTFVGTATVTDLQESALFSSSDGATCSTTTSPPTAPANAVTISCSFGQVKSGASRSFAVFFLAPLQDTISPTAAGSDFVSFSGVINYSESSNDSGTSFSNDSAPWSASTVLLGTNNPTQIKSAVPKGGGNFFTGSGAVTTAADPFATKVTIPQAPTFSSGVVDESDVSSDINCTSLNHFYKCYQSAITIPNIVFTSSSGSYLTIVLRIDASNIKSGTKISDILIQYVDESSVLQNVGACASPTTPRSDGIPCIADSKYYKNRSVSGWTLDLDGDFEWTLLNLKNGGYKVF